MSLPELDAALADRFARLALACVHREYPSQIGHRLERDEDVRPPRLLTPVFYGCFDWHSAVHNHWLLVRLARTFPDHALAMRARAALAESFQPARVAAEVDYLGAPSRATFERPYGLAWLLQLVAELREWDDPDARAWASALQPLERLAVGRLWSWLPKLTYPVRTGEHSQTAFALGLALDWALGVGDAFFRAFVESRALDYHLDDRDGPLHLEPSGHDFLSPCLAEADLVRRVLPPLELAEWLSVWLPGIPTSVEVEWLAPAEVTDPADGKLAHLDGLNLSRAWMLQGIAARLPEADARVPVLRHAARTHAEAGIASVTGAHYEGGHWLPSFAVYLLTARGTSGSAHARAPAP